MDNLGFQSIQLNNGKILDGEKIGELTDFIINKFSEEKLSYDEARIVLEKAQEALGECSVVEQGR